jgi:hypothetical protein
MKNQSESVMGHQKHLKLALTVLASILILSTSAGVIYQIWLGTHLMAVALSLVVVAEAFVVCYCNAIVQLFKTLDNVNDLISD